VELIDPPVGKRRRSNTALTTFARIAFKSWPAGLACRSDQLPAIARTRARIIHTSNEATTVESHNIECLISFSCIPRTTDDRHRGISPRCSEANPILVRRIARCIHPRLIRRACMSYHVPRVVYALIHEWFGFPDRTRRTVATIDATLTLRAYEPGESLLSFFSLGSRWPRRSR